MDRLGWSALLVCIAAILRLLGPIESTLECLLIAAGLAGWCAFSTHDVAGQRRMTVLRRWLPAAAGYACLTRLDDPALRLAIVAAIALATPGPGRRAAAGTAAVWGAWSALVPILPGAWSIPVAMSRAMSEALGSIARIPVDAGPTASGLWLLGVWLTAASALRAAGSSPGVGRILAAFGVVCLNAATLGLPSIAGPVLVAHHELDPQPQGSVIAVFARGPVLLAVLCALLPRAGAAPAAVPPRGAVRHAAMAAAGAVLAASLAAAAAPGGARRDGDVVLRLSETFDMQVPVPGRYGTAGAGMYGMLPKYLALDGHRVRTAEPPLEADTLADASVLVVITPAGPFAASERRAIHAFVDGGGSLLVMGDHTDLMSTMGPINDLTARYGMRIRFDSAFAARAQWAGCLAGVRAPPAVGTGASLEVRGTAVPTLRAPYAFSDDGDRGNGGPGAFTGDMRWRSGEQAGDLVLAAQARSGRGRVALFGDTSILQNVMLPWSWEYVAALFDDLARSRGSRAPFVAAAAGCVVLLAAMGLRGSAAASAALVFGLIVAWGALRVATGPGSAQRLDGPGADRVALIDDAHANRQSRHLWKDRSLGGLAVSLQRAGWIPIVSRQGFARALPEGSLAILIEPRAPLSRGEIARLADHCARGGTLLVAASARAAAALQDLLAPHGIAIHGLPLGPVPLRGDLDETSYARALEEPQFRDAWPVSGPPGTKSHYAAFGRSVVVDAPRGNAAGRLIVLADPDFLTDRVLENETAAWPGNVAFLEQLLASGAGS